MNPNTKVHSIQELKILFDSLGRDTFGRLIIENYDEEEMRKIIEFLFAKELSKSI